jgi:hypothetical protein
MDKEATEKEAIIAEYLKRNLSYRKIGVKQEIK